MIDYIKIEKDMSNEDFDIGNVPLVYGYLKGKHNNPLKVRYNKEKQILTIEGSLPYFSQGHNFFFGRESANQVICEISNLLGTDLYEAEVKIMEYGVVVCPDFTMKDFLGSHVSTRGYEEEIYTRGGKNYVKRDDSYTLKFYSLWANIDNNRNKIDSEARKWLSKSNYSREHNPMRYEIHGNPKKIFGSKETFYVSDMLTPEFEERCGTMLLKKYRNIKKHERVVVKGMKRLNTLKLALSQLSECDKRYQENMLMAIDKTDIGQQSKYKGKKVLKDMFYQLQYEKCLYSIEELIIEELEREQQENSERL